MSAEKDPRRKKITIASEDLRDDISGISLGGVIPPASTAVKTGVDGQVTPDQDDRLAELLMGNSKRRHP